MTTARSDKEIRRELIDEDYDPAEFEQKIGEGWTAQAILEDAKERGLVE